MPSTRCTLTTQRISRAIAPGHRSPVRFLRSIPPQHTALRSFADPILQIGNEPFSTPPCGTGPMPPPMTGHSGRSLWQGYVTRCTSRFPDRSLRPWHCARKAWPRRRATTVQHSPVSAPRFWPQPCWQPCGAHQPTPPSTLSTTRWNLTVRRDGTPRMAPVSTRVRTTSGYAPMTKSPTRWPSRIPAAPRMQRSN